MSLREWLIIIGALVILAVLLDGVRRMYRARQDAREFSQGMGSSDIANTPLDDEFNPELPNGGSRVIQPGRDSETAAPEVKPTVREPGGFSAVDIDDDRPVVADDEPVMPDEPVATPPEPRPFRQTAPREEPETFAAEPADDWVDDNFSVEDDERPGKESAEPSAVEELAQGAKTLWNKLRTGQLSGDQEPAHRDSDSSDRGQPASSAGDASPPPMAGANRPDAVEVWVVNVQCKGHERLSGKALKRLFEGCGLEYGDMDIYHRHETPDTRSPVQFSVANAVSPGTFRPDEMQDMQTPGISFFMSLPGPNDPMQAFDFMLETAQTVVRNLGGELKDEQRSVMTAQTIEHSRQRIREFVRRQRFPR